MVFVWFCLFVCLFVCQSVSQSVSYYDAKNNISVSITTTNHLKMGVEPTPRTLCISNTNWKLFKFWYY